METNQPLSTKDQAQRRISMLWWKQLSELERKELCDKNQVILSGEREPETLTGR